MRAELRAENAAGNTLVGRTKAAYLGTPSGDTPGRRRWLNPPPPGARLLDRFQSQAGAPRLPLPRFVRHAAVPVFLFGCVAGTYFLVRPVSPLPVSNDDTQTSSAVPGVCDVAPLAGITDPAALDFEMRSGAGDALERSGLTRPTARALARFERLVTAVGGAIGLRSAYRPAAYQAHLQAVWDKWVKELRDNREPACDELRAQVGREFERHGLLESQRPASISDHTRGLAFDARVSLPAKAKYRRRLVTVDKLARLSGIFRPVAASDPVHFRLFSGRYEPRLAQRGGRTRRRANA